MVEEGILISSCSSSSSSSSLSMTDVQSGCRKLGHSVYMCGAKAEQAVPWPLRLHSVFPFLSAGLSRRPHRRSRFHKGHKGFSGEG